MTAATKTEAVIVVRMLPPRECSPNFHGHWRRKAEAAEDFREEGHWATICGGDNPVNALHLRRLEHAHAVTIDAEIAWCCGRKRMDDDNAKASLKAAIDGIADVLWNGQDRHVTIGTVRQCRGDGTVTITLRSDS